MKVHELIDSVVSTFSPRAGIRRHVERDVYSRIKSKNNIQDQYKPTMLKSHNSTSRWAAAKDSRLIGDWNPVDSDINDLLRMHGAKARARIRQLIRDFPIFSRAVRVVLDYQIGVGLRFQSKVVNAKGEPADLYINRIEEAWKYFVDEADFTGKLDFGELTRAAKRQELECGEYLFVKRYKMQDKKRFSPFCVQIIEPDLLTDENTADILRGNEIDQGVEYVKKTGEVAAYHIIDPDSWGRSYRVPAKNVIHGFDYLRAGQRRGISPFVSGVMVAGNLGSLFESEVDGAKLASKYLAFVQRDIASRMNPLEKDDDDNFIDEMENAIIEYLNPGEKIEIAKHDRPGGNFPPTVALMIRFLSAATGVPYELLSFDYKGVNYNGSRVIRNDFSHQMKPDIKRHAKHFCSPIANSFLDASVMVGKLSLPNYVEKPELYQRYFWQPPGTEGIDWLKESKAQISEMGVTLRSPQEIMSARGRDFDEVINETSQAIKKLKAAGLGFLIPIIWKDQSTSTANNPAAIDKQSGGDGDTGTGNKDDDARAVIREIVNIK